ncbi:MAG: hypothetical protein JW784_05540, partial [Candidatus Cloacimonetes bacterium]|nr:hypothetical protein [Candidatus Cloacimonadota bacterium]
MKYPVLITFLVLFISVWSDGNEISQPDYNLDNRYNPYTSLGNRGNVSSQYGSPEDAQKLVEKA